MLSGLRKLGENRQNLPLPSHPPGAKRKAEEKGGKTNGIVSSRLLLSPRTQSSNEDSQLHSLGDR